MSVLRNGFGPAGLANSVYVDPYGPRPGTHHGHMHTRPWPQLDLMSPQTARTRRIPLPPYDWTASAPHPSGNHLSSSGTWRKGNAERYGNGVADFQQSLSILLSSTRPEDPSDSSVRFVGLLSSHQSTFACPALLDSRAVRCGQTVVMVRRAALSTADGLPHLHTDTIGPRNVLRAPAHLSPSSQSAILRPRRLQFTVTAVHTARAVRSQGKPLDGRSGHPSWAMDLASHHTWCAHSPSLVAIEQPSSTIKGQY